MLCLLTAFFLLQIFKILKTFENYCRGLCLITWVLLWCCKYYFSVFCLFSGGKSDHKKQRSLRSKRSRIPSILAHLRCTCKKALGYWWVRSIDEITLKRNQRSIQGIGNLLEEWSGVNESFSGNASNRLFPVHLTDLLNCSSGILSSLLIFSLSF